jgi:hypothetical protein
MTSWSRVEGTRRDYVHVTYKDVVVGHDDGTTASDFAGSCGHAEFLAGRFQPEVRALLGDPGLEEVLRTVRGADQVPELAAKRARVRAAASMIEAIPRDAALEGLMDDPATEVGYRHYGNRGRLATELHSDTTSILLDRDTCRIASDSGEVFPVEIPGLATSVVALADHYFVGAADNFFAFSPRGELLFTTYREDPEGRPFGREVRVGSVLRRGETIGFLYVWLEGDFPSGVIVYEVGRGLIRRCEVRG